MLNFYTLKQYIQTKSVPGYDIRNFKQTWDVIKRIGHLSLQDYKEFEYLRRTNRTENITTVGRRTSNNIQVIKSYKETHLLFSVQSNT